MITSFTEGRHGPEFLKSEANGYRSRDNIVVASGSGILAPGTIVGRIAAGVATAAAKAGNTGNGVITMANPSVAVGVRPGVYRVIFLEPATNLGTFEVEGPDGILVGTGVVGVAFTSQVKFTIADGATDFVSGDGFDITVAAGSGKFAPTDLAAIDGSNVADAIILLGVDATSADVPVAAIRRQAEVYGVRLAYHASVNDDAKKAAKAVELAARGIHLR